MCKAACATVIPLDRLQEWKENVNGVKLHRVNLRITGIRDQVCTTDVR